MIISSHTKLQTKVQDTTVNPRAIISHSPRVETQEWVWVRLYIYGRVTRVTGSGFRGLTTEITTVPVVML